MLAFIKRYWFSAVLVLLLLLAVPGVLLFALAVHGSSGTVNDWLQDNYRLTYHMAVPHWSGLLVLLVPPLIVLLYFLKLKRRPLAVPSTFLWKKSIEDLHVNSLLQWLRQNVLLLLQLLAALAIIYGLMAFRLHGGTEGGRHYILMIDNSASMAATDVAPSRLEWAKEQALKEIEARGDNDFGMVIAFNSSAEIVQSYTANRALLRQAVHGITPTQRPTRIEEALSLADSLANPLRSTEDVATRPENAEPGKERTYVPPRGTATSVHLFSDGRFPDPSEGFISTLSSRLSGNESALGNLNLRFHLAGVPGAEKVDNIGLVALNAQRDEQDHGKIQVFARALNFRPRESTVNMRLELLINGALGGVYDQRVALPARKVITADAAGGDATGPRDVPGEGTATFELHDIDDRADVALHARLVNVGDKFALDDEAWLVISEPRRARVLIVGKPDDVLDNFFNAEEVQQVARVTRMAPDELAKDSYRGPARNGVYDLVVFDRCAPAREQDLPESNTFFIGVPPPPWMKEDCEKLSAPRVVGWLGNHPVMRDLRALYTMEIDQALKIKTLPPRTPLLIEGRKIDVQTNTDVALLVALARRNLTDLVLTFPIINDAGEWNTTWPLQASFPLFLRNVLYSLGNLNEAAAEETLQPGQVKTIRTDAGVERIQVSGPDGETRTLTRESRDARPRFAFGATDRVGLYRYVVEGSPPRSFAVNLLDEEESNIEPRPVIQVGPDEVASTVERGQPRELWKWFALLALVLLMIEWYIYNRRVYV
jgi:hypothetical protein